MRDRSCPVITYSEIKKASDSFCFPRFVFFIYIGKHSRWFGSFVTASVPGSEI